MIVQLYQFRVSHYCEKVRFALSYKGVPYQEHNLLPGLHHRRTNSLAGGSAVPVISHQGQGIQGSAAIISYLDETFPERSLTPVDLAQCEEALEWERWLDQQVGVAVRCYLYHHVFARRGICVPMMGNGCTPWEKVYLQLSYRRLIREMRQAMQIDERSAAHSLELIRSSLDRVQSHLQSREFLVGDSFSRADLTAAALFAPLFRPVEYGMPWPEVIPEPVARIAEELMPRLAWARQSYRRFRVPATGLYQLPS
jgi:glutathione S-transferase